MAQVKTKTLNARSRCKLPPAARRLIEENKQRRAGALRTGGDFRGRLDKTVAFLSWKTGCNTISDAIG
ncbi:MAG: hypothetical protein M3388_07265 [Acidobacteriota bacterium]|nr:hypothetical protein [Acidobacteriota bacterium]